MIDKGSVWPDPDVHALIDGKIAGLTYGQVQPKLSVPRTEKAIERKWARIKKKVARGESPFASGEIVDPSRLQAVPQNVETAYRETVEAVELEEKDNGLTVHSKSRRIKNIEDLITACQIDLDVWEIERHVVNKWEVGAKQAITKIDDDGYEYTTEEIVVEPLFQVKAWLVRKQPIAIDPVVSPVHITVLRAPAPNPMEPGALYNAMTLPDPQCGFYKSLRTGKLTPFHDRGALDVALQIAQDYEIRKTIWLGDLLDLAEFTDKFVRSPNYYWSTQPAAIECKWWLTQFVDANPKGEHYALEGNHEERLREQLLKHFKEAYKLRAVDELDGEPLMSIPKILAFHDIGMQWIEDYPNSELWINDQLACEHGAIARAKSGGTVSAMAVDASVSRIVGHTHRLECATKTIHEKNGPRTVQIWSMGCLCRVDGVVPGRKARQNWQQALGFVEFMETGEHTITPVEIHNGRAIFRGKVYEARDRLDDLREATAGTKAEWNW